MAVQPGGARLVQRQGVGTGGGPTTVALSVEGIQGRASVLLIQESFARKSWLHEVIVDLESGRATVTS